MARLFSSRVGLADVPRYDTVGELKQAEEIPADRALVRVDRKGLHRMAHGDRVNPQGIYVDLPSYERGEYLQEG